MPVFSWNSMEPFGKSVSQSFNLTDMCVEYVPFSKVQKANGKRQHLFKPNPIRLPDPIPESFISMSGLGVPEFRAMELKINSIIQEANGVSHEDHSLLNGSQESKLHWSILLLSIIMVTIN
jgi:hypothetical protein